MNGTKKFGEFDDGDVLIVTSTGKAWKLHAGILQQHSAVFRKIFNDNAPPRLSKKRKFEGKTILWKIRMVKDPTSGGRSCAFKYVDPKAKTNSDELFQNVNGLGGPPAWLQTYENLFRALYSVEIKFSDKSLEEFISEVVCLLQAAEILGAEKSVSRIIETHLLRSGQPFWRAVRAQPGAWTDIAVRIESPVIYREAMVHLVGVWTMDPDSIDNSVDKEMLLRRKGGYAIEAAVLAKIEEQTIEKRGIEMALVEYFPPDMIHQTTPTANRNGNIVQKPPPRQKYADDIYLWQSLCLVRMYISAEFINEGNFRANDGGAVFYRAIAAGADVYLGCNSIEIYFQTMNMTNRGKICLYEALVDIKDAMKPFVAPLVVNNSVVLQEDGTPMRHKYLTHTIIPDNELPWYVKPAREEIEEEASDEDSVVVKTITTGDDVSDDSDD